MEEYRLMGDDGSLLPSSPSPSQRQPLWKRKKIVGGFLSLLSLAVVAAIVATVLTRGGGKDDAERNRSIASELASSLSAGKGRLELEKSIFGSHFVSLATESFSEPGKPKGKIVIELAELDPSIPPTDVQVVKGVVTLPGFPSLPAKATCGYVSGKLTSSLSLSPDAGVAGNLIKRVGRLQKDLGLAFDKTDVIVKVDGSEDDFVGVSGVLPAAGNLAVSPLARLLLPATEAQPAVPVGHLPVSKHEYASRSYRNLRARAVQARGHALERNLEGYEANNLKESEALDQASGLPFFGSLQPTWKISGQCPGGLRLSAHVTMVENQCEIVISSDQQDSFAVSGTAVASLPGNDDVLFSLFGAAANDALSLEGPAQSKWKVLKRDDLVVADARFKYSAIGLAEQAGIKGTTSFLATKVPLALSSNLARDGPDLFSAVLLPSDASGAATTVGALFNTTVPSLAPVALADLAFVASSARQDQLSLTLPSGATRLVPKARQGITLSAVASGLTAPEVATVTSLSVNPADRTATTFTVAGLVSPRWDFTLEAPLSDLNVGPGATVSAASLVVGSRPLFGFSGMARIDVAPAAEDEALRAVVVDCTAEVRGRTAVLVGTMTTPWAPASFSPFQLSNTAVAVDIDLDAGVVKGALTSKLALGSMSVSARVAVDAAAYKDRADLCLDAAVDDLAFSIAYLPGFENSGLPGISVTEALVLLCNHAGTRTVRTFPTELATIAYPKGVSAFALSTPGKSFTALSYVPGLGDSVVFNVGFDAEGKASVAASFDLLSIGEDIVLRSTTLSIANAQPFVTITSTVAVDVPSADGKALSVAVSGSFDTAQKRWSFAGTQAEPWVVTPGGGSVTLSISSVKLSLWLPDPAEASAGSLAAYEGAVEGVASFAGMVDLGVALPLPYREGKPYHFSAKCPADLLHFGKVTVDACSVLVQSQQPNLAASLNVTIAVPENSPVQATLAGALSYSGDLNLTGTLSEWHPLAGSSGADDFAKQFAVTDVHFAYTRTGSAETLTMGGTLSTGALQVPVFVDLAADSFLLAAWPSASVAMSALPGAAADSTSVDVSIAEALLVVVSKDSLVNLPAADGHPEIKNFNVKRGLNFMGTVTLSKSSASAEVAALASILGDGVTLRTSGFLTPTGQWSLTAGVGDISLPSGITITSVSVTLNSQEPHLQFQGEANVVLSSTDNFRVTVGGTISGSKATITGTLSGKWTVAGVDLSSVSIELDIDASVSPVSVKGEIQGVLGPESGGLPDMIAVLQIPSSIGPSGCTLVAYPSSSFALRDLPGLSSLPSALVITKAIFVVSSYAGVVDMSSFPLAPSASLSVGVGFNFAAQLDLAAAGSSGVPELVALRGLLQTASPSAPLPTVTVTALVTPGKAYSLTAVFENLAISISGNSDAIVLEQVTLFLGGGSASGTGSGAALVRLNATTSINVPHQLTPLVFSMEGIIQGSAWSFSAASQGAWIIPVGSTNFTASDLTLSLTAQEQKLGGRLDIGGFAVVISADFPLSSESRIELDGHCPADFPVGKNLVLENCAIVITETYFALQASAVLTLGSEKLQFGVDGRFGPSFVSVAGTLSAAWTPAGTSLVSVPAAAAFFNYTTVSGTVVASEFRGTFTVASEGAPSGVAFGFQADIGTADLAGGYVIVAFASAGSGSGPAGQFPLASAPRFPASAPLSSEVQLARAAIVYASRDVPGWTSPAVQGLLPTFSMDLVAGVNFRGDLALSASPVAGIQAMSSLLPSNQPSTVQLSGHIAESGDFAFAAALSDVTVAEGVTLTRAAVSVNVTAAGAVSLLALGTVTVSLPPSAVYAASAVATLDGKVVRFAGSLEGSLAIGDVTLTSAQVTLTADMTDPAHRAVSGAIQGRVLIGGLDLVAQLQFPSPLGSASEGYVLVAYPAEGFLLNSLPGMEGLPHLSIDKAIFVVSPFAGTLDLTPLPSPPAQTVTVGEGLNFICELSLADSAAPELAVVRNLASGNPARASLSARVSTSAFALNATLTDLTLGGGAVVLSSASLLITSTVPQFSLSAVTSVAIPNSSDRLGFAVAGSISGSAWSFSGRSTDTWTIPVADTQMTMKDLNLQLASNASSASGYSGSFHGELSFADFTVEVDMAFPLSEGGGHFDLNGHCPPDFHLGKRVVLSDCAIIISTEREPHYALSATAVVSLPDNNPFTVAVAGSFGAQSVVVDGSLTSSAAAAWHPFGAEDLSVTSIQLHYSKVGAGESRVDVGWLAGSLSFKQASLAYNATIIVPSGGDETKFAFAAFPSASGSLPWGGSFELSGAAVVLCNYEGDWTFPGTAVTFHVKPFFNVYAEFSLSSLPEYDTLRAIATDPASIPTTIKVAGWMSGDSSKYSLSAAISDLKLGDTTTVKNCVIGIHSEAPQVRLDTVLVEVRLPRQTLLFNGSATVAGSAFEVNAAMTTEWQMGSRTLQNATVHLARSAEGTISGKISADFRVGSKKPMDLQAFLEFPFPAEQPSSLVEATSTAANTDDASSAAAADTAADNAADTAAGTAPVAAGATGFALYAYPAQSIAINMLPNVPDSFPDIYLSDVIFILATGEGEIDLSGRIDLHNNSTMFHFHDGLTFIAEVSLFDQPDLGPVKTWLGNDAASLGVVTLVAELDNDPLVFYADIANLRISDKVELTSVKLQVQTVSPWFQLDALTTVALDTEANTFQFSLHGHVAKDDWGFSAATANPWVIALGGDRKLTVTQLSLSLRSVSGPGAGVGFTGSLNGAVLFGDLAATISVAYPVPQGGLVIAGRLSAATNIAGALAPLAGGGAIDGAAGSNPMYGKMKGASFRDVQFRLQTSPAMLQVTGSMLVFGDVPLRAGAAVLRTPAGEWGAAFGLALGDDFKFSSADSSLAILDDINMPKAAFAISSVDLSEFDLFLDQTNRTLRAGFAFEAELPFRGRGLEMVKKWTGIEVAVVRAEFLSAANQFTLRAGVHGHFRITDDVEFTDAGLFLKVSPGEVQVGVDCTLLARLSEKPQDQLQFYGAIFVSPDGAGFEAAMQTPWVEPFGARGVTVLQSAVTLKLSFAAGLPTKFGVAGGLQIGKSSGELVVLANLVNFRQSMFKARLAHINVLEIVEKCTHHTVESSFARTALNVGFEELLLYVNGASAALEFNGQLYPPGFEAAAREVNLFGVIRGSAYLKIMTDKGLDMKATVMPFSIGNLISVSGATGPTSNATFALTLMKGEAPRFLISGAVELFGKVGLSVLVDFNDAYVLCDVAFTSELFEMQLMLESVGEFPRVEDFIVDGMVNQKVLDYIAVEVPKLIDGFVNDATAGLKAAQDKVAAKQSDLDAKRAARDAIKAEVARALAPAIERLNDASESLSRAQAKVDRLLDKIKELERERSEAKGFWNTLKRAGLSVEIAALWVAHKVASAALDVAQAAVSVAKRAVGDLVPELDPRVIALNIEIGVLEAAYSVAQLLLKAAEKLVVAFGDVTKWLASGVNKLLNVQSARVSGSLKQLKAGNLGNIEVHMVFLGKNVVLKLSLDFSRVDRLVESVFGSLAKSITS